MSDTRTTLTEIRNGKNVIPLRNAVCGIDMPHWCIDKANDNEMFLSGEAADKLAKYEKAEAEGRMTVLPCKVGDIVYFDAVGYHDSAEIDGIHIDENGTVFTWVQYEVGVDITELWDEGEFDIEEIGKTVFLTREEAEQALEAQEE